MTTTKPWRRTKEERRRILEEEVAPCLLSRLRLDEYAAFCDLWLQGRPAMRYASGQALAAFQRVECTIRAEAAVQLGVLMNDVTDEDIHAVGDGLWLRVRGLWYLPLGRV